MDHPKNLENQDSSSDYAVINSMPVAYIRPMTTKEGVHYAVCSADGTQLAIFGTRDAAFFAAKQHDLDPVLVH
jgi:hypothetical protein